MQEDCFWFTEKDEDGDDIVRAMCIECHKKKNVGMFWPGKVQGYGDYDLNCAICETSIYKREDDEAKTAS